MVWKPHVTVAAIVRRESDYLMIEERTQGALVINQPAGHLEEGESLVEACVRETLEETGWRVRPLWLTGIYRWRNPNNGETMLRHCFYCETLEQVAAQPLDASIERALWLDRSQLAGGDLRLRSPLVLRCIDDHLAGQKLPLSVLHDVD